MQPAAYNLLRLLQARQPLSDRELTEALGMSSAETRSLLAQLHAEGVAVELSDFGYALNTPVDLLDAAALKDALPMPVDVIDECASTNTLLLESTDDAVRLVVCELQTDGRGRRGNRWHSGLADSLSFSLSWFLPEASNRWTGLPLAVGVACARALRKMAFTEVALKWPNDLVHPRGKLAGVLIEMKPGSSRAVIGIGLNIRNARKHASSVGYAITDLSELRANIPDRTDILIAMVRELVAVLKEFDVKGFAAFREEWSRHHAFANQRVRLSTGAVEVEGLMRGVGEDGALLLMTERGEERFLSGELLRAA
ncbi:MAG TPA: biotin--[acetyl-CoA-carboxylase] ligase [Burkholderiales bacterium]|nr:biotin--[acetyl-CoA-carboxylase] ligase [Burkholderiales bacterium]